MAKQKPMTVEQILETDINKIMSMPEKELRKNTVILQSAVNKRLKRLREEGVAEESPAYQSVEKFFGKKKKNDSESDESDKNFVFSVKDLNRNDLVKNFAEMKKFMGMKTSSVAGYKTYRKEQAKMIADEVMKRAAPDTKIKKADLLKALKNNLDWSSFWKAYRMLEEDKGGWITKEVRGSRDRVVAVYEEYIQGRVRDPEEIVAILSERIREDYEKQFTEGQVAEDSLFTAVADSSSDDIMGRPKDNNGRKTFK